MVEIVWFKRDLRINDHEPLLEATKRGDIIPLHIIEPDLWKQPDVSDRQYHFLTESLSELNQSLKKLGQELIIKVGNADDVFINLINQFSIKNIWSHQETWNYWTYQRDINLRKLFKSHNVNWIELPTNGVVRNLAHRKDWARLFYQEMKRTPFNPPTKLNKINLKSDKIPSSETLGIEKIAYTDRQKGGENEAMNLLGSFLHERSYNYSKNISSPLYSVDSCSRLSTYLAFGNISLKQIFYQTNSSIDQHKKNKSSTSLNLRSINAFKSRLRWRSHFIQKLEDQPDIEYKNLHSGYDGLRENDFNEVYYQAWCAGETGFPFVDACMRSLVDTGWINFRMRAMLVSFAANNLWLDWKKFSHFLSKIFTDYEPGIHYSQLQMQSGTTGINTIRIYNPIKQSFDQDKDGIFIKRWVNELSDYPNEFIHEPWKSPLFRSDYISPIIDEVETRKIAASKLYSLKARIRNSEDTKKILQTHVS